MNKQVLVGIAILVVVALVVSAILYEKYSPKTIGLSPLGPSEATKPWSHIHNPPCVSPCTGTSGGLCPPGSTSKTSVTNRSSSQAVLIATSSDGSKPKPFLVNSDGPIVFKANKSVCLPFMNNVNNWVGWNVHAQFPDQMVGPRVTIPEASPANALSCVQIMEDGQLVFPNIPIFGPFSYPPCPTYTYDAKTKKWSGSFDINLVGTTSISIYNMSAGDSKAIADSGSHAWNDCAAKSGCGGTVPVPGDLVLANYSKMTTRVPAKFSTITFDNTTGVLSFV